MPIKGSAYYLDGMIELLRTKYAAKVAEINGRGESHLTGALEVPRFWSKSVRKSIDKYPALFVMPGEVTVVEDAEFEVAYGFDVWVVVSGKNEEVIVQSVMEHELAVTEILVENPNFASARTARVSGADYSDIYERGTVLVMQVKISIAVFALEPERYFSAEGGSF